MCGIFGYFSSRAGDAAELRATFPAALAALAHRGPDDRDACLVESADLALGFAQTRLAILDLSPAGHQPMRGPGGEVLLLNGEIYNHLELRPALEAAGVAFVGTSDTETLLHLLIREGVSALTRVVGMFAFAFWDPATRTLTLGRDRFGKKPLYLAERPGRLAFASEVRALLATGAAPRTLDPEGLALWLERGSCHEPTTLVRGVRSLAPGHVMTVRAEGGELRTHSRPYWSLQLEPPAPDWRDRLEVLLDTAVRQRLLSDRPIGVFLSGGVDSAAIAAVAARHARDALRTFTLTFDEREWDEGARARTMAERLGLQHQASHLTAHEALAHMDEALAAQDLPSHDGFNTWFVTRAARASGLVVALTGTGGDELFQGYPHFRRYRAMLGLGALGRRLPEGLRARLADGLHATLPTRWRKALALIASEGRPERVYAILREMFPPLVARRLAPHASAATFDGPPVSALGDREAQLSQLELGGYLVDTQLRDIDAMSMAHGLEVRSPLLDHRLVQAVLALPASDKAPSRGINKRLLVDLAGLPRELFAQPKRGFVIPWDDWLRGPLAGWIDGHLAGAGLLRIGLEPRAVAELVTAFRARRVAASRILSLVALAAWCLRHGLGI